MIPQEQLDQRINSAVGIQDLSHATNFDIDVLIHDAFIALEERVNVEALELSQEHLLLHVDLKLLGHRVGSLRTTRLDW